MNKKTLYLIIIIAPVIILGAVYFYSKGGTVPAGVSSLISAPSMEASTIGNETLSLLNQVKSINIDSKFFQDGIFLSLVDITQPIPTVPVFRANPFAPVPGIPSPLAPAVTNVR
jgi:hypothetical protein